MIYEPKQANPSRATLGENRNIQFPSYYSNAGSSARLKQGDVNQVGAKGRLFPILIKDKNHFDVNNTFNGGFASTFSSTAQPNTHEGNVALHQYEGRKQVYESTANGSLNNVKLDKQDGIAVGTIITRPEQVKLIGDNEGRTETKNIVVCTEATIHGVKDTGLAIRPFIALVRPQTLTNNAGILMRHRFTGTNQNGASNFYQYEPRAWNDNTINVVYPSMESLDFQSPRPMLTWLPALKGDNASVMVKEKTILMNIDYPMDDVAEFLEKAHLTGDQNMARFYKVADSPPYASTSNDGGLFGYLTIRDFSFQETSLCFGIQIIKHKHGEIRHNIDYNLSMKYDFHPTKTRGQTL
jgi:hypothetical protein